MEIKFGAFLRKEREKSNLTLKDITDKMGWSVVYLSDIERGKRNPPSDNNLFKISKILGIRFWELLDLANRERGRVELSLHGKSESVTNLALYLSKSWDDLDDLDADRIRVILKS